MRTITIDPATRLEGHGRVEITLDEQGQVSRARFIAAEFRGFETFCVGRPAEEMPRITTRVCGVCPTAHHLASVSAVDQLFLAPPPAAAVAIRELLHQAFFLEDHLLHVFFLAGPDLFAPRSPPPPTRDLSTLVQLLGEQAARDWIAARSAARSLLERVGGKPVHPVFGLPGGVSQGLDESGRELAARAARLGRRVTRLGLDLLKERLRSGLLGGRAKDDPQPLRTYYLGLVDHEGRAAFHQGVLRVVDPEGREVLRFAPADYQDHIAERVEPGSYLKVPYLRRPGWQGYKDGMESGVYRVGPLARMNVCLGMASAAAEEERQALFQWYGGQPVHSSMAYHWARLIECLQACDRLEALSADPVLLGDAPLRSPVGGLKEEAVGAIEAPRGTLIHHYRCDPRGIVTWLNLIPGTVQNSAALSISLERAARSLLTGPEPSAALLNQVEMAYRAYDPCVACATHAIRPPVRLVSVSRKP